MLPGKTYTPEDVVWMAWRHKWKVAAPFVLIAGCTVIASILLPDRFRSETTILVIPQRVPESYVRSTVTARIEDRLQSIGPQILSRTRLERIILDFNLYSEQRRTGIMEDIVARMRGDINIDVVRGDAFRVSFIGDDPQTVQRVTDRLASLFIDENLRDRELLAEGTNQFLDTQLEEARLRLIEQERKLAAYQQRYAGQLPTQAGANLQVLQSAQMQLQALLESVNRDRDRKLAVERALADLNLPDVSGIAPAPGVVTDNPGETTTGTLITQLSQAQQMLRALEARGLTPEHPDVIRVRRLVADLRQRVEAAAAEVPLSDDPADDASPQQIARQNQRRQLEAELQNLDQQIAAKQAEEQRLHKVSAEYQQRLEIVPTRQAEMAELTRDYGTLQSIYQNLLSKREESRIAANLERRQVGEHFKLLDPANLPERPFTPNRVRINLIGALFGLALGVGFAALIEYRDTTLKTDDDVTSVLALPVLARIPVMTSTSDLQRRRRWRVAVAVIGVVVTLLAGSGVAAWRAGMFNSLLD